MRHFITSGLDFQWKKHHRNRGSEVQRWPKAFLTKVGIVRGCCSRSEESFENLNFLVAF